MNSSGKTFDDERPSILALILSFASLGFALWSMSEKAWLGGRHEITKLQGNTVRWVHIYEPLLASFSRTTTEIHNLETGERLIEGTVVNKLKQTKCYTAQGLLAEMHIQLFPRGQHEIVILDLHSHLEIARKVLPPETSNVESQISSDGNSLLLVNDKMQSGQTVEYELELLKLPTLEAIDSRTISIPNNSSGGLLVREDWAYIGFTNPQELIYFGDGVLQSIPVQGLRSRDSVHDLNSNGTAVVQRTHWGTPYVVDLTTGESKQMPRDADMTNSQIEFLPDGSILRTTESEMQILDASFHLIQEFRPDARSVVFLSDEYSPSRRSRRYYGQIRYRSDGLVEIWDPARGEIICRKDFELRHWISFIIAIVLGIAASLAAQVFQYWYYHRFSLAHFILSLVSLHCIAYNLGAIKISTGIVMAACILTALYLIIGRAQLMDRVAVSAALLGIAFVGPAFENKGYRFENVVALIGSIPLSMAAIQFTNLANHSNLNVRKKSNTLLGLFYLTTATGLWVLAGNFLFQQYIELFSTAWCISLMLHITCIAIVILGICCSTGLKRQLFSIGALGGLIASGFAMLLPVDWQRSGGLGGMHINLSHDGNVLTNPHISLFIMGSLLSLVALTNSTSTNKQNLVEPCEHMQI